MHVDIYLANKIFHLKNLLLHLLMQRAYVPYVPEINNSNKFLERYICLNSLNFMTLPHMQ